MAGFGIIEGATIQGSDAEEHFSGSSAGDLLIGLNGSDIIAGNAGDDQIYGGGGADILLGGQGDDYVNGGTGTDTLYGGYGDDVLIGGAGGDVLSGDFGADVLTGGSGNDTFLFKFATAGLDGYGGYAADTITDFEVGDTLLLEGFFTPDNPGLTIFGVQSGSDVVISVDVDGDGTSDYDLATVIDASIADVAAAMLYA